MIRRQGHDARSKFASRTWPSRETRRVFCGFCRGFCRCCGDRDAANILYYYREWNVMMNQRSWCDCTIWWWWGGGSFRRCGSESASAGVVHSPSTTTMTPSGCVSAAPELEWKPASVVGMRSTNAYSCNWCTREARFQQTLEVLAFRAFSCIYLVKCVFILSLSHFIQRADSGYINWETDVSDVTSQGQIDMLMWNLVEPFGSWFTMCNEV